MRSTSQLLALILAGSLHAATVTVTNTAQLEAALGGTGVTAGDTVVIRGGTYSNLTWTVGVGGTAGNLITWSNSLGEVAKIDGQMRFADKGYHRFVGLEFYDSNKSNRVDNPALHFDDQSTAGGNEWLDCYFHDMGNVWSGTTGKGTIRGCVILYPGKTTLDHVLYPMQAGTVFAGNILGWHADTALNLGGGILSNNIVFGGGMVISNSARDFMPSLSATIQSNSFWNPNPEIWKNVSHEGDVTLIGNTMHASAGPIYNFASATLTSLWNVVIMNHASLHYPAMTYAATNTGLINSNSYYSQSHTPVVIEKDNVRRSFAEWQSENAPYDANSTATASSAPTVSTANVYTNGTGKAHIAVYNWGGSNNVSVDVSGIYTNGQSVRLINAQNYAAGAFSTGTVSAASIALPMTNLTVQAAAYWVPTYQPQAEATNEFAAFVVEALGAGSEPPSEPPASTNRVVRVKSGGRVGVKGRVLFQ